ncbi:MAG TPA: anthranilate synthase component I family protein, partial [Aequorivita sp.]|nr:anthranilate synthase component I family protein [Aequorivita sp.]
MRIIKKHPISLTENLKKQLLLWAQQFNEVVWLDGNDYPQKHGSYRAILAVDAFTALKTDERQAFDKLKDYQTITADWVFGYLSYDLKNDVEKLESNNFDGLNFPDLYFFQPKKIFLFHDELVEVQYLKLVEDEIEEDWKDILKTNDVLQFENKVKLKARTSKVSYFQKVHSVLEHIKIGNIYEANFCQEFYSEAAVINPIKTYLDLNNISKTPFSAFLKLDEFFALSASPERYIKRTGDEVVSQPIKGTIRRSQDLRRDAQLALELANDPKERSENIMIVDLVRNDLSRVASKGSVEVEELCGVYSFMQVHQLISTISCRIPLETPSVEILRYTFPMGSMTGAPKISAMKIMEDLEDAKRGVYSGSIGYFTPSGDFDFNVVIRSILYNSVKKYISFSVGGAITINSLPE